MALAATCVFDVRTGGSDANAGFFDPTSGTPGTDYSQQNAAQVALTDMVIDGTTNTKFTSATLGSNGAYVGNGINVTSGTGFTVQRVQILSHAAGVYTCDKSLGTLSSTGGMGNLGGALLTPGMAAGIKVAGNDVWVATGTYTIASTTANIATGKISESTGGASTANRSNWRGYNSSRWTGAPTAGDITNRPMFQVAASGVTAITVFDITAGNLIVSNIKIDGQSKATIKGLAMSSVNEAEIEFCYMLNCPNQGMATGAGRQSIRFCEINNCGAGGVIQACTISSSFNIFSDNVIHDCPEMGISVASTGTSIVNCLIYNIAASKIGISCVTNSVRIINTTIYSVGSHGIDIQNGDGEITNCIIVNCGGWGINNTVAGDHVRLTNNALFNNTSGDIRSTSNRNSGTVTLTGDPFTSAAGGDFSLNNTAGRGAACRAGGYPGLLPGGLTTGYQDIGAVQHAPPAGGGGLLLNSGMTGGLRG